MHLDILTSRKKLRRVYFSGVFKKIIYKKKENSDWRASTEDTQKKTVISRLSGRE